MDDIDKAIERVETELLWLKCLSKKGNLTPINIDIAIGNIRYHLRKFKEQKNEID